MKFTTATRRTLATFATAAVAASVLFAAAPANAAPAGARDYVCVLSTGQTIAVQSGKSTAATCKGANAIQIYYATGQFIKTVSLTPAGKPATAHFTPTTDCLLATVTGGVRIVMNGKGTVAILKDSVLAGKAVKACVAW